MAQRTADPAEAQAIGHADDIEVEARYYWGTDRNHEAMTDKRELTGASSTSGEPVTDVRLTERAARTGDEDLLVFLDETGHEDLGTAHGLFGIGGIISYGADYLKEVIEPWRELRRQMGWPEGRPLHAAGDMRHYGPHVNLLGAFFCSRTFVRHASMVTLDTVTDLDTFVTTAVGGFFRNVGRTLARVRANCPVQRVVFIVEHSARLHSAYQRLVGERGPTIVDSAGNRVETPHQWATLKKTACEPGLEVSDFVLHAAQAHVRAKQGQQQGPPKTRKDFESVFRAVHPGLVEYMELNKLESTADVDGPSGMFRIPLL